MRKNWFNRSLPLPKVKRSMSDLGEDRLQTMALSRLCPIGIQEALPKDLHMFSHDSFLRLAPLKYPILQNLHVNLSSFFVPSRLIIGEESAAELFNAMQPSEALIPKLVLSSSYSSPDYYGKPNNVPDYYGIQVDDANFGEDIVIDNPIPFFAYILIVRDYFLDEVLEADLYTDLTNLLDRYKETPLGGTCTIGASSADYELAQKMFACFQVNKDRDYFSSARPTAQTGDDVYILPEYPMLDSDSASPDDIDWEDPASFPVGINLGADRKAFSNLYLDDGSDANFHVSFNTTVRDLFTRMAYQRLKNVSQNFGTRYNEFLAGNFGVVNQDVRLQRPECIGRSKGNFQISEVIQTSASEASSPLGGYAGRGIGAKRTRNFRYFCNEHGFLIHLVSVVPTNGYMSGAPRWLFKTNGLDFALPQFNNVGEQPVYKGELYYNPQDPDGNFSDFGYQSRYSEYRSGRNYASAGMRQSPFTAWHLFEQYDDSVALTPQFIKASDSNRIFNLDDPTAAQNIVGIFKSYHLAFRPISNNPK